jgi:hypothetical protein
MPADRAYNGSVKYVKHQKLDQSASLFLSPDCVNPANPHFYTTGQVPAKDITPSILMGCTGNALATGIDAPLEPKVSLIPIRSHLSAEVLGAPKTVPICSWNYVI